MPPKAKFTREEIVKAGLVLVQREGIKGLTARTLGKELGSSSCPIFTLFQGMEEVVQAVIDEAHQRYTAYLEEEIRAGKYPAYKASGMAYIRFAREEKELFKLLFMRDRTGEKIEENREEIAPLLEILCESLGLGEEDAYLFHLEMWVYVHGIATMLATDYLAWELDFVSKALTDMYQGLKYRYTEGRKLGDRD